MDKAVLPVILTSSAICPPGNDFSLFRWAPKIRLGFLMKVFLLRLFLLLIAVHIFGNQIYTLKKGDTLYGLSRKFNISVELIQEFNQIKDPSQLREGAKLKIPGTHIVQKGETLYSIARLYTVDLKTLMRDNHIVDSRTLKVGTPLLVPYQDQIEELTVKQESEQGGLESQLDVAGIAVEATAVKTTGGETDSFWPHPGTRGILSGKMFGVVIRGKEGDRIVSVSSGKVVWEGPYRGFSRVVFVESQKEYIYVYTGNETTRVRVGDWVQRGEEIGRLGRNAHQGVAQLYFLVYHDGQPVDPQGAPRG